MEEHGEEGGIIRGSSDASLSFTPGSPSSPSHPLVFPLSLLLSAEVLYEAAVARALAPPGRPEDAC